MSVAASLADVLPAEALSEPREPGSASPLGAIPEAVVHPESPEQVAATIEWACANGLGVLPMASGRRVRRVRRGRPFLALRTDRMRGIEIYEPADLTLTAGAGTSVTKECGSASSTPRAPASSATRAWSASASSTSPKTSS